MLPFRLANVVEIYRKLMDYVQFLLFFFSFLVELMSVFEQLVA